MKLDLPAGVDIEVKLWSRIVGISLTKPFRIQ
jgi:hypothetical protein